MDESLGDFLTLIDGSQTLDEAFGVTVAYLKAHGIEHVHYVYAPRLKAEQSPEILLRRTTSPGWWLEHYATSGFVTVDPGVAHCTRSSDVLLTDRLRRTRFRPS